ncbi:TetR/AcrR family transcriptional regulator [Sphingomonas sp. CGMCC 1.13654]|uniref:TetR/AcrR family transcriptional regulator n=1 Tax=Sphingomonas chungangi TaxID=2683589 RepID=A0A838L7U3_9SPHN|nr:helix-turn-helix domain-containing protein [Sphingomonas chungangi]MBA2933618.1 TetR/AcrR family transcriptional regulator [Sphingomonas chungangi]MVW54951.1 TetR family transcriptional regulator [Sphingomonas chungangi]
MVPSLESYAPGARKIILAAEELIAARGYEGTSQREILRTAGQANKSAIRHHFGTKHDLVREIFYIRQGEIDEHRRRRTAKIELALAERNTLMGFMLFPILDAFQGRAREVFANFVLQLMLSARQTSMFAMEYEAPVTREIRLALRLKYDHLPDDIFTMRLSLAVVLFLQGIVQHERLSHDPHGSYVSNPYFWDELFSAALAVLDRDFPPQHLD